jgi:hypothetical protein
MQLIEAPNIYPENADLFLGGGITNCPDWQAQVVEMLEDTNLVVLNPRRSAAFTGDIADEQIRWEYEALRAAKTVLFWFPKETLCPITLFELGVFSQRKDTRLIVGTHPDYARRFDVQVQMELSRPEVLIHDNIEDMVSDYLSVLQADALLDGYIQLASDPEYRKEAEKRKANRGKRTARSPRTIDELIQDYQNRQ